MRKCNRTTGILLHFLFHFFYIRVHRILKERSQKEGGREKGGGGMGGGKKERKERRKIDETQDGLAEMRLVIMLDYKFFTYDLRKSC